MGEPAVVLEDDFDDTWFDNQIYDPEDLAYEEPMILQQAREKLPVYPGILPSQFAEFAFRYPTHDLDGKGSFGDGYDGIDFTSRPHMKRIYDTPAQRVLLMFSRQSEKCVVLSSMLSCANGWLEPAGSIEVGEKLVTMASDGSHTTTSKVVWKSKTFLKSCVRIHTRQGHITEVARTHPMRTWDAWTEAGQLQVGDRVAVVRKAGVFGTRSEIPERVRLTAYMLGDGHFGEKQLGFSSMPGVKLLEVMTDFDAVGTRYRVYLKKNNRAVDIHARSEVAERWFFQDGLMGTRSATKFIPHWVFELPKDQTALFLNRLWSTDGHAKLRNKVRYDLTYCSISKQLVLDLQALLWKFGIPSHIRIYVPKVYRSLKYRKLGRVAYLLHIQTQEGVRLFLSEIGALGKTEGIPLPSWDSNSNQDTYPFAASHLIKKIASSVPRKYGASFHTRGLQQLPSYCLSRRKFKQYVDFLQDDKRFDRGSVADLAAHVDTDLFWDEVTKIEDLGRQKCVDFEVTGTHNFVCDGFITHNSTLLGNMALCYMSLVPECRVLYVSPSATQAKKFSNDRIKGPIETSPVLKKFTTSMLSANILEKQFINRSVLTMRYAFLNADRVRGIPGWRLEVDEFQDVLSDNLPVIEQCLSHAPKHRKSYIYAGTPKSLDNNIEVYWSTRSSMNEWVIPHDCRSGEAGRYWNILGEKNIGKKGLICENCGTLISPKAEGAAWASMVEDAEYEGYHISQLMVPWVDWKNDILIPHKKYGRAQFYNEVLGLSYDSGLRPLTRAQVIACCNPQLTMSDIEKYRELGHSQFIYAGVDWGGGSESSYSVLTLATYIDQKFRVFYMHRFMGEDMEPLVQIEKIIELCDYFNVALIGCDYGGGLYPNDVLMRRFGPTRVWKFQYMARAKMKVMYNPKFGRFQLARTEVMSDIFNAIKRKKCEFPRYQEFDDPHGKDMLNIFSEFNKALNMIQYKHNVDKPDDSFHSLLYCWLVSMLKYKRPDIIAPRREVNGAPVVSWPGPVDQG